MRVRARVRAASDDPFWVALGVVAVVALALRLVNIFVWRPTVPGLEADGGVFGDSFYYHWQARALAQGLGFIDPASWLFNDVITPSAGHPPVYSSYLALWSWLGADSPTAHRVASSLLGVATVVVVGLLARQLVAWGRPGESGRRAGLAAAAVAAVYPGLWINDGMLLSESAAILAITLTTAAAYAFWHRPSWRRAGLLGFVAGIAALSRTEMSLLFPAMIVPLALMIPKRSGRERLGLAAVACAAGATLIVPWVGHNLARFEEPVLMTSGTGAALSAASCDEVFYGGLIGFYANCFEGPFLGSEFDESQRDIPPRKQAEEYTRAHLSRLPVVVAARVGRVWGVYRPGQNTFLDWAVEDRGRAASWAALVGYYLLAPVAVVGIVSLRRRRIPILPMVSLFAIVTFAATITFGVTRYRATAEAGIVILAAVGADAGWRARKARSALRDGSRCSEP